jgi:hypothetical protein
LSHQTENPPKSAIERATEAVMSRLNFAVAEEADKHGLHNPEFRRILAGYFENQSMRDWCAHLHIPVPEGHRTREDIG